MFVSKVRRVGGSQSVLVPAAVIRALGIEEGDDVEVEVRPLGKITFDAAMAEMFEEYNDVFEALADR